MARLLILLGVLTALLSAAFSQEEEASRRATVMAIDGAVTPATASYLTREIEAANARGDEFILIEIDTPGGLIDSMKSIVKSILASDRPVVTYVAPQGARSASAGLYIMYAAHVSAMAPATNTGSATPVGMGGEPSGPVEAPGEDDAAEDISDAASMRGKIINDSVAYIRALAQRSGRNAEWAEKAVRPPSTSATAEEALALGVIEIVAEDRDALVEALSGMTVTTAAGPVTIETENLRFVRAEPSFVEGLLGFFANPNVAAILLTLGTTGLIVELWNPGSIFPGVFGAICLALAFYSFQVLPFEGLYLGLVALGVILLAVEAFTPTFGLAGLTGLVLLGAGLYFVFPGEFRIDLIVLGGLVVVAGVLLGATLVAVLRSRSHGPLIGSEAIRKREGRVESWDGPGGWVIVDGERWRARSKQPLEPGDRIKVQEVDGLVLIVRKASAAKTRLIPGLSSPDQQQG